LERPRAAGVKFSVVKVKATPEQATKAKRRNRGIDVLLL
jgi:hypothetical protein